MTPGVVGIDVGGTGIHLLSADGERSAATGPAFAADDAQQLIRNFIDSQTTPVRAVGIAVPGLVDGHLVALSNVLPGLNGWAPSFGVPVTLLNDVDAALAEALPGTGDDETAGMVMVGSCLGAAFVTQGRRLQGARGFAGELGHAPVPTPDGPRLLNDLAGGRALLARTGLSATALAAALAAGDANARAAVRDTGRHLGWALAWLINVLNPGRLVVGGGTLEFAGLWPEALAQAEAFALPPLWAGCRVERVADGKRLVARGAARAAAALL
jgi:predicted NBD/HSP70 family sugar kinase